MKTMITEISITLPDWVKLEIEKIPSSIPLLIDRIHFVIKLSRLNVEHGTGGPFAAAVFEKESGRIISVGVNMQRLWRYRWRRKNLKPMI